MLLRHAACWLLVLVALVVWVGGHASDAMRRPLSPAGRGGPVAGTSYSRLRGGEEEHRRPLASGDGPDLGRLA